MKRGKTDAADAEAICEAVTRPTMRFAPVKSAGQQASAMVLKTRDLLVRQRSQTINALRAHLGELGVVTGTGVAKVAGLVAIVRDVEDDRLPAAGEACAHLPGRPDRRTDGRGRDTGAPTRRRSPARRWTRRLTTIPGVGPITAAAIKVLVPDIAGFDIRAALRRLAGADAEASLERRQGAARRDLEDGQRHLAEPCWSSAPHRCCAMCARGERARMADRAPGQAPAESGGCGIGQQDGQDRLRASDQGW